MIFRTHPLVIAPACTPPRHPQWPSGQLRLQGQCTCPGATWQEGSTCTQLARRGFPVAGGRTSRNSTASMRHSLCGKRTLPACPPPPASPAIIGYTTQQIIRHWQPFHDLKQTFAVSRRAEQLGLRSQQGVVATAKDSVLRIHLGLHIDDAPISSHTLSGHTHPSHSQTSRL